MSPDDVDKLLTLARVPIFELGIDTKLQSFNQAAADILGFTEGSVGREVTELLPQAQSLSEGLKAAEAIEASESCALPGFVEVKLKGEEGRPAGLLLLKLVLQLKDGSRSIAALGQDLCEVGRKAVEEKKKALNTIVSQEVRTPLHGMVGLAVAMEKTAATAGAKKQLGMIRSCASRLLDVVTNALELSEGEVRKDLKEPHLLQEKVSFAAVAEEVVTMTRLAVDKANKPLLKPGVEIKNLMANQKDIPVVLGSASQCTQLLYNLVVNACKFTPSGSVSIGFSHLAEANELEISVVDTGAGIAEEAIGKIFQPFQQERGGGSASSQGLGLGLAVCKAIAESHGGRIRVESQVGKGTSFVVTFPCAGEVCDQVDEVITPKLAEAAGLGGTAPEATRTVLLAISEEDAAQAAVFSAITRDAVPCELVPCKTPQAAMDWLKDKVPAPAVSEAPQSPQRAAVSSPGFASEAEVRALKQELARHRSKQQYVLERLKMQIKIDAALQSQTASPAAAGGDARGGSPSRAS